MKQAFLVLLVIAVACAYGSDCEKCNHYKIIVLGAGGGGVGMTYQAKLVNKLNTQLGLDEPFDLSDILLIEKNDDIGGDAMKVVTPNAPYINYKYINLVKKLYNYTGPFVDIAGPQRVPYLTARLMRGLAVDSGTLLEITPYYSYEDTRGRNQQCPKPDFNDYSPSNPWGMPSLCTGVPKYVGDTSVPFKNSYSNGIGPAYNLTDVQDWAYVGSGDGGLFALSEYFIYGSPNPVTCDDPNKTCQECGDCFADTCNKYINLQAAMIGQVGHELTNAFIQDYGGFYGDFAEGLHSPCAWADSDGYWQREFDTNTLNGYPVGTFNKYIDNMANPIKYEDNILLNTEIVSIDYYDGEDMVSVRDSQGNKYTADFLVFAAQPEHILNGNIGGNLADALLKRSEFHSVYSIDVITIIVQIKDVFWDNLLPLNEGGINEWVLLRSFGDQGCIPRLEIQHTPYGATTKSFRASYSDHICKEVFQTILNDQDYFQSQLWRQLKDDIAYIFSIPKDSISDNIEATMTSFPNGWYYMNSNATVTPAELAEWAAKPLGDNVPICLIQEAWHYKYLGWLESSLRLGQNCLDRINPGSKDVIEKYLYELFPECPPELDCYSNPPSDILGTETIVPSRFCNERFWINDYTKTSGCIDNVQIN